MARLFERIGDHLVSTGSPMRDGFVLQSGGSTSLDTIPMNGYSIIQADSRDEVISLVKDHPYLSQGSGYSVEIFELPGA